MTRSEQALNALAAKAAVTAGLLNIGAYIAQISIALLMLGLLLWLLGQPLSYPFLLAAMTMALVQVYFALRVRFDANIFRTWATRWHGGADPRADLIDFDRQIGRKAVPGADVEADLTSRRNGALQLMRLQIACVVMQLLMTAIAFWL
ncbi:MAG: hypothetical protein P8045_15885 [Candidatus Thiodiazotropha sp.]|jgi:hypothetical protein